MPPKILEIAVQKIIALNKQPFTMVCRAYTNSNDTRTDMNRMTSAVALLALTSTSNISLAQDQVEYAFTFHAEWSQATHPTAFPSNPHFSPIIGATHTDALSLWEPGGIATNGIEVMAETGSPSPLSSEVSGHINAGLANQFINLGGVALSPDTRTGTITVDADFPLISLVTMIAPSPDWFVGIHGVDLRPNGIWARELVFDLDPYDSGTDSGANYTSGNANVSPHLPIANLSNTFPFTGSGRIGTFTITLVSDASCSHADLAEPFDSLDFFDVSAFISAYNAQDESADFTNDGVFDFFDVSAFINAYSAGCP